MKELLKLGGSSKKLVCYALLVHSKRYGNPKGKFYMSNLQIVEATGLCERTVRTTIKQLENEKVITVFRSKVVYDPVLNKPLSKPNEYITNIPISEDDKVFKLCNDGTCENCLSICLSQLFQNKEIRKTLSRREYQTLIGSKELICSNL